MAIKPDKTKIKSGFLPKTLKKYVHFLNFHISIIKIKAAIRTRFQPIEYNTKELVQIPLFIGKYKSQNLAIINMRTPLKTNFQMLDMVFPDR